MRGKRAIGGGRLEIVSCVCGAAFQPEVPGPKELAAWYDYMARDPLNLQTTPVQELRLGRMVEAFESLRRTGRLVEIGLGCGLFARAAMARGWEVCGTEISPSCIAVLRPLMAERLHAGAIETIPFASGSFDGAAMIEVLEHLDDPMPHLAAVRRLLRPGGRLYVTTPNRRGATGRLLGTQWRIYCDEHLSYFDAGSVERLLTRAGFVDIAIATTNLDMLGVAMELRDRLPRRIRQREAPTVEPQPLTIAATPQPSTRPRWRARGVDLAIEAVNTVARLTMLGDALKVTARRP